ncbi:LamB/YcsF family protein [Streptomyces sp. KM273126]|uniref:LamB/YcsF family protein n=1 Tax=Streptomyces sp. KM273126 TaxID=2545247 RepID=UPI00103F3815|nr:LamB/YcsF family protein [Streptomyces sp. KM273126]MBA2810598.1 LamB/YcsF family protein [Streptomyces sp. KM273126]
MGARPDAVTDPGRRTDERFGGTVPLVLVTSSNITHGYHVGDPRIMDRTVADYAERGIDLGAHPVTLVTAAFLHGIESVAVR